MLRYVFCCYVDVLYVWGFAGKARAHFEYLEVQNIEFLLLW